MLPLLWLCFDRPFRRSPSGVLQQIPEYHAGAAVVTAGDLLLLDVDDLRASAFRADDVKICRFGFLGAVIIGPDRCQHVEARIGEKYQFVYNITVEDVKRSLCAGVSKPASRRKGRPVRKVFWQMEIIGFKVNLDIAACGRLWIFVTSIDTKLETT
jgi:hypothetical protein